MTSLHKSLTIMSQQIGGDNLYWQCNLIFMLSLLSQQSYNIINEDRPGQVGKHFLNFNGVTTVSQMLL